MIAGQYVPVDHYDNHSVHLEELNNYRKGPQFEQIRQKVVMLRGPDGQERPVRIGDLFEAHAKGHAIALVQSMRGKMALEATEGGQAGEQANGEPRGGANETAPKQPAAEASRTS